MEDRFLGLTADSWAAAAGWVAATSAIWALIAQGSRERFSRGVEIVSRLDGEFRAPSFKKVRSSAAFFFGDETASHLENDARELLSFFEKVAFLYKKKAIDANVIWHFFGSWILPYYHAARAYVTRLQRDDPNVFRDFDELYEAVHQIEEEQRLYRDADIFSKADYQSAFLARESTLGGPTALQPNRLN